MGGRWGHGFWTPRAQQDLDVLDRSNQPVLNLDAPQPPPPRPLEPVVVGRIRKTTLDQMLPALPIPPGGGAVGLAARLFQQGVVFVAVNRAPGLLRPRALRPQRAGRAAAFV